MARRIRIPRPWILAVLASVLVLGNCVNPLQDKIQQDHLPKAAGLVVKVDDTPVADGESFDFGEVGEDQTDAVVFTITNSGNVTLNLTGSPRVVLSQVGSAFQVTDQPDSPIAPGASTTFTVEFTPPAVTSYSADVSIQSDAQGGSTYEFELTGTGYDITIPQVNITSPANGAYVRGTVTLAATASDDLGVTKVEFYVDAAKVGEDPTAPYQFGWVTTAGVPDGSHSLKAVAYDGESNTGTDDDTSVIVDNAAPVVNVTSPTNGSTVGGAVTITASASDVYGVQSVAFYANGTLVGSDAAAPYQVSWTAASTGSYALSAVATDLAGNTATDNGTTVSYDKTAPTLTVSAPAADSVFNTTSVAVSGTASDANGVQSVEVRYVGGSWNTASGTTSWSYTLSVPAGDVTVAVRATDVFGNVSGETTRALTILSVPGTITATGKSDTVSDQIIVIWGAVPGSGITYHLYGKKASDSSYAELASQSGTSFSHAKASTTPRTDYNYYVQAEKSGVYGPSSSVATGYRHGVYEWVSTFPAVGLDGPMGVDAYSDSLVYVCNERQDEIREFDMAGADQGSLAVSQPSGVVRYGASIFVTSYDYDTVYEYSASTGTLVRSWASNDAFGICADATYLYVSDRDSSNVYRYTHTGGSAATLISTLQSAQFLEVDSSGRLFVVDSGAWQVKVFSSTGAQLDAWSMGGSTIADVVIDDGGYFIVTDSGGFVVLRWDPATNVEIEVQRYSNYGTLDGQFETTLYADYYGGYLFIVDLNSSRVQRLTLK